MFWQEDEQESTSKVSDDIVDVRFSIDCRRLPVDHAYALSAALLDAVPWLADDPSVGVHTVHVAGSQNGWERPSHGSDQDLVVSRRTKLTIRLSKTRMGELIEDLKGKTLNIAGNPLTIGEPKTRSLSKETTLFSRYVAAHPAQSEDEFLSWAAMELRKIDVRVRKALCGRDTPLSTPHGMIHTRSLMLADLSPDESVRLQQTGLGPHRQMGCGIFIPHKGIEAVRSKAGG
jgi:CRISPR-associated protein Cas6